jgi:hypothetical protein
MTMMRARFAICLGLAAKAVPPEAKTQARGVVEETGRLELRQGDRIILIGNTLAELKKWVDGFYKTNPRASRPPEAEGARGPGRRLADEVAPPGRRPVRARPTDPAD